VLTTLIGNRVAGYVRSKPTVEQHHLRNRVTAFQTGPFGWLANIPCNILFGRNLKTLATIYVSDKWNSHWYAQYYEDIFRRERRRRVSVLEIGVGGYDDPVMGGSSLRMWNGYFPNGRIYGIDLYDKSPHDRRRIKTFRGSQTDSRFLDMVVREIGKIDVIIDDGSHRNEHILFAFQHLFPHLADGGVYAIEDIQTSYWSEYGGNEVDCNDTGTAMGYFKSLADGLNWEEYRGNYSPTYLDQNIKWIAFYHNLIIIRKGSNREGSNMISKTWVHSRRQS
jgi:methyltransferase family protein